MTVAEAARAFLDAEAKYSSLRLPLTHPYEASREALRVALTTAQLECPFDCDYCRGDDD